MAVNTSYSSYPASSSTNYTEEAALTTHSGLNPPESTDNCTDLFVEFFGPCKEQSFDMIPEHDLLYADNSKMVHAIRPFWPILAALLETPLQKLFDSIYPTNSLVQPPFTHGYAPELFRILQTNMTPVHRVLQAIQEIQASQKKHTSAKPLSTIEEIASFSERLAEIDKANNDDYIYNIPFRLWAHLSLEIPFNGVEIGHLLGFKNEEIDRHLNTLMQENRHSFAIFMLARFKNIFVSKVLVAVEQSRLAQIEIPCIKEYDEIYHQINQLFNRPFISQLTPPSRRQIGRLLAPIIKELPCSADELQETLPWHTFMERHVNTTREGFLKIVADAIQKISGTQLIRSNPTPQHIEKPRSITHIEPNINKSTDEEIVRYRYEQFVQMLTPYSETTFDKLPYSETVDNFGRTFFEKTLINLIPSWLILAALLETPLEDLFSTIYPNSNKMNCGNNVKPFINTLIKQKIPVSSVLKAMQEIHCAESNLNTIERIEALSKSIEAIEETYNKNTMRRAVPFRPLARLSLETPFNGAEIGRLLDFDEKLVQDHLILLEPSRPKHPFPIFMLAYVHDKDISEVLRAAERARLTQIRLSSSEEYDTIYDRVKELLHGASISQLPPSFQRRIGRLLSPIIEELRCLSESHGGLPWQDVVNSSVNSSSEEFLKMVGTAIDRTKAKVIEENHAREELTVTIEEQARELTRLQEELNQKKVQKDATRELAQRISTVVEEHLSCSISTGPFVNPVFSSIDKQIYEEKDIKKWLAKSPESPITHEPMTLKDLSPVPQLKGFMEKIAEELASWKESNC